MMFTSASQSTSKRHHPKESIYFLEDDLSIMMRTHEDPLIITIGIGPNSTVDKVIINSGSSVDVL